ncbi:SusD/RagB family nutrient-binding outer membrane lipoprotein [Tenacibaculum sp. 190524A02b]|uniref:SusD/RagB family nutrient-binding outer membrane lipoprotein n=1 Tax=Tenacibaculum vairaonense TaxID=3137860 RepID=UPI0031FB2970
MNVFKNISKGIVLGMFLVIGASCTEDFDKTNTDTKSPEEVEPRFLLPTAQSFLMNHYVNHSVNSNVMFVQSQHFSQTSFSNESNFNFRDGLLNSYVGNYYNSIFQAIKIEEYIAKRTEAEISKEERAAWSLIVTTLKAFGMQHVTDANGPAIYREAFDIVGKKTPAYESQEDVYKGLMQELYTVSSNVDTSVSLGLGAQDIIYKGDLSKWQKFANSILLRYAMRVSDVAPDLSKDYFNKAVNENGGVFASNADNALFQYIGTPNGSRLYESILTGWGIPVAPSNTIYDLQQANQDPRINIYWSSQPWGSSGGIVYGNTGRWWDFSHINAAYAGYKTIEASSYWAKNHYTGKQDAPGVYIDYAEVEFFLAEAAVRGGYAVSGSAKEHYDKAVEASIRFQAGIVDWAAADIDNAVSTYLALPSTNLDNATNKLAKIGEEKWVALFMQSPEAWAEARRLDSPTFNVPAGKTAADIPTRLIFSGREKIINGANVEKAKAMLKGGADTYTTKLWWDVN